MLMTGVLAVVSFTAFTQRRTDRLLAGIREADQSFPTTRAKRTCIHMAMLSDKQRALRALQVRLLTQAQREVLDTPSNPIWGAGSAEALANAIITFPPVSQATN